METGVSDRILLRGMRFYGYHGVNPEEQELGQRFEVDVELSTDLRLPGQTDNLSDTINYSAVYRRVQALMTGPPRKLIEAVAHDIALELLRTFASERVAVTVRKLEAPLKGAMLDSVGVQVVRSAADLEE